MEDKLRQNNVGITGLAIPCVLSVGITLPSLCLGDRCPREDVIQVHQDGAGGWQSQGLVSIPPVFDKGDIWMGEGGGRIFFHRL